MVKLDYIMNISGMSGLYKMLSQGKSSMIVESLVDGKRHNVIMNTNASFIRDITIFTVEEELVIADVFQRFYNYEKTKTLPTVKDSGEKLKEFFTEVVPEHDEEKVYISHIKKMITWYMIVKNANLIDDEPEKTEEIESNASTEEVAANE